MRFPSWFFRWLTAVVLLAAMSDANALILYDANSTSNTKNVIDPANSSTFPTSPATNVPWQYVVRYGVNNATAVYLGNGYLLTARHVGVSNTGLLIQGTTYARDTSFVPVPITVPGTPVVNVDLQLQKISGDPGLAVLPLASPAIADTNKASVLVGWGVGKGTPVTGGWNWGDDSTRAFRWGTNTTSGFTSSPAYAVGSVSINYTALTIGFNSNQGVNEASTTLGDSGSALFQSPSGNWVLTGITTVVSDSGASYFSPSSSQDYFVRLREYAWALRYDAWKTKYGIASNTADSDDSDGDGMPLLTEYALGLDPTVASTDGAPVASVEGTNLVLTFTRMASTTDVKVEIETSSTLQAGEWTVQEPAITVLDSTTVVQKLKATIPLGTGDRIFARLKVTKL